MQIQKSLDIASKLRIFRIKEMIKSFDDYCKKEPDPEFQDKARNAVDEMIGGMYGRVRAPHTEEPN